MISTPLAQELRAAGLEWAPLSGDSFQVARDEFEGDVFTVSDMTIEARHYPTGTILGFNGTTEWALDSLDIGDAIWLPREDQLRDLLGERFVSLERRHTSTGAVEYTVSVTLSQATTGPETIGFCSDDASESYAMALLAQLRGHPES